jgi:pimeloyl-ACP methyl ester carboxylesterase
LLFVVADWRLDVDSMAQTTQLQQLAQAIIDRTSASNRAILMGHSIGALVARKLLELDNV